MIRRLTLRSVAVSVDFDDPYGTGVSHPLLGDGQHGFVVRGPVDSLDRGRERPGEQASSGLHFPKLHFIVSGTGDEEPRFRYGV